MVSYNTGALVRIIDARLYGDENKEIDNISIDSRKIINPGSALFFAIRGPNRDGHRFIHECRQLGVRAFVVDTLPEDHKGYAETTFLVVQDTIKAIQQLAAYHRKQFKYPVIAITGSNGKTIVKEWLNQLLEPEKSIVRSPKSYNSQIGVPLSLFLMHESADRAIIEAGISLKGEMEKLEQMIKPDTGIITNIGEAHQENFSGYDEKINEKIKLFSGVKTILYCRDYDAIHKAIKRKYPDKHVFSWSTGKNADVIIKKIEKAAGSARIKYAFNDKKASIVIPFSDRASVENAIHCLVYMLYSGYDPSTIKKRMKVLSPVAMRLEIKQGINDSVVINDSYNSDLNSLSIAIDFLNQQSRHEKKTLILSDILQSGMDEAHLYRKVSEIVQQKKVHRIIGIGNALKQNAAFFTGNATFYESTDAFIQHYNFEQIGGEAILLKGARPFRFERISRILENMAHRTVLEVNLNALLYNLNYFRSRLYPGTRIMVMVKAFSYGSGLYEVASFLQYHRVDCLGVAFVDEGVTLRKSGIKLPVMVMQPEEGSFDVMIEHGLEPEIYSFIILEQFIEALKHKNIQEYPVHIKVDTGMRRLGFMNHQMDELIKRLKEVPQIKVQSVFSHLAASDEEVHDEFTRSQFEAFEKIKKRFGSSFDHKIMYHILNSAGTERFPEYQYDMVRLGIGLYGVSCLHDITLKNISSLKSRIIQIKTVHAGETVGYGRKGLAGSEKQIAVVPIGYADGLNRHLSNGKGYFMVRNQKAPIFGTICMDVTMIDVTGLSVFAGEEVIIFGAGFSIEEMAKKLDTIPYEILTGISQRVKRVYYQDEQ